jgi:hypothetical protein
MFQIYLENFTLPFFYVGVAWGSVHLSEFSHVLELHILQQMCLISFRSLNPPPAIFTPVTSELWWLDTKLVTRDVNLTLVLAIPECRNINNNNTKLFSVKHTYIYCTYVV